MATTTIYGLFDRSSNISEKLNQECTSSPIPNVSFEDFAFFKEEKISLLFSGVLYNKEELLSFVGEKQLEDAQLLWRLFQKESYQGFKRINGKFLIIVDDDETTWVVRDRYGQGPLFYYTKDFYTNIFWQVKHFKDFEFKPHIDALGNYLMYSYIPSPLTSIEGLNKLTGGQVLIKDKAGFKTEVLFTFEEFTSVTIQIDEQEALEEYDRLFKLSIKRRIG
ncbi:MAG: hypothetical protein GQ527_00745, partial [Bacteroidales bacterium]|nr:hypothetical protein [Bacteroidales bacterium]